jgi:hypothetical protein
MKAVILSALLSFAVGENLMTICNSNISAKCSPPATLNNCAKFCEGTTAFCFQWGCEDDTRGYTKKTAVIEGRAAAIDYIASSMEPECIKAASDPNIKAKLMCVALDLEQYAGTPTGDALDPIDL